MGIPIKTSAEDIEKVCGYLATKPTGATIKDAKAVVNSRHLDARKLSAMKTWGFIEEAGDKIKLTSTGRAFAKGNKDERRKLLRKVIENCPPYLAILERAVHQKEDAITATDVAALWHDHYKEHVATSDSTLNDQALCYLNLAQSAGLGELVVGRSGSPTRIKWNELEIQSIGIPDVDHSEDELHTDGANAETSTNGNGNGAAHAVPTPTATKDKALGQSIFLAHGRNKGPLEQLKKILSQFNIPFKLAVEEPNLGRPIGGKVREIMQQCNCAILIFTADEKFLNKDNEEIWRPSENVIHELGACGYLYDNRIVIIKEDKVLLPTNFRELGYISFSDGGLDSKAMDIVKELIGFGIIKIST